MWDISNDISELFNDITFQYIISSYTSLHFTDLIELVQSSLRCLIISEMNTIWIYISVNMWIDGTKKKII